MGRRKSPALVFCKEQIFFLPLPLKIYPFLIVFHSGNVLQEVSVMGTAIQLSRLLFSCMRGIVPFSGTHSGKSLWATRQINYSNSMKWIAVADFAEESEAPRRVSHL
jgi:uncharacterized protein (DUF697 family)